MTMHITPRTLALLAAIFALALVVRLAWLANTDTELLPMSDPQYYHATASNLADGRGYSVAVDPGGGGFVAGPASEGSAFWAPGYPFALAPLYPVCDDNPRDVVQQRRNPDDVLQALGVDVEAAAEPGVRERQQPEQVVICDVRRVRVTERVEEAVLVNEDDVPLERELVSEDVRAMRRRGEQRVPAGRRAR